MSIVAPEFTIALQPIPHGDAEVQRTAAGWLTAANPEKGRDAEDEQGLRRRHNQFGVRGVLTAFTCRGATVLPLPLAVHFIIGYSVLDIGYSPLPFPPSPVASCQLPRLFPLPKAHQQSTISEFRFWILGPRFKVKPNTHLS